MINKEICSDKQKENKYLHDINMKVSDSTMGYNNEEYYRNNHYLRSDEILLEDVKRDKNNKDINEGSTRKRIIEIEKTEGSKTSVTKLAAK